MAARIYRSGRPERVDSYEGLTGSTADLLRELGFRSSVGAPIRLGGRLWGAVMVSTVEEQPFPEGSEQRIADFAELVALALANAEAREELAASRARIVEAGDAERRRLERNLHDGAQQRLVAVSLGLRMCERKLAEGDAAGRRAAARRARRSSPTRSRSCASSRAASIRRSSPTTGSCRRWRCWPIAPSIPVEISAPLDERLPQPVEAAAYYIVAEALTNASKHAQASHVRVTCCAPTATCCVEVADDGVGNADQRRGSGLRGLRDRVEALGGELGSRARPAPARR